MQVAIAIMRKDDPTSGTPGIKLPKRRGHHTWTDAEIEQSRAYWPLGTQQRLVFEFALETVSRRGEVVRLGPQHVKNGRIRIERRHGSARRGRSGLARAASDLQFCAEGTSDLHCHCLRQATIEVRPRQ